MTMMRRIVTCAWCCSLWIGQSGPDLHAADDISAQLPFQSTISGDVIHASTIELPRLILSDVIAYPVMSGQILRLSDVRAQAYGGIVTGTVSIDLRDLQSQRISTQLVMTDLNLALLGSSVLSSGTEIAGSLSGTLELTIMTDHPEQMVGHGEVSIRNASLVNTSWFTSVLMGDLGKSQGHDSAVAQFDIGNGQWIINQLQVQFSKAQITMRGTVSFDGDMNMQASPRFGSFLGLVPLVGGIFDRATGAVTSRLAHGVLRGPVANPVWIYRPFGE